MQRSVTGNTYVQVFRKNSLREYEDFNWKVQY